MRRILPLLLALSVLLSGCGKIDDGTSLDPLAELNEYYGVHEEEEIPPLTTFTLPYHSGETWDPITCGDGVQQTISSLIYEPLFRLDDTFTPQPLLVSDVVFDDEGLTCTLHLRSGVRFSDGAVLTAQDVAATLLRAAVSPRYAPRLHQIKTVVAQGNTVVITLTEENRAFTALLDIPVVRFGTEKEPVPVGTGPYVPSADMSQLVRNVEWWQALDLPFEEIALRPYKSEEAAAYAFTSHDVHLFVYEHLSDEQLFSAGSASSTDADTTVMHYLSVNMRRNALSDPALRQAVSLAIDREELTGAVLSGHAVATQFPLNPISPLYPTALEADTASNAVYEAMTALELTDGEKKIPLRLLVNSENDFKVAVAGNIAAMLNRYDFDVTVVSLPWDEYLYNLSTGNYDLYYGECKLSADWNIASLLGSEGSLNYGGYESPECDALMAALRSAADSQRAEAMGALCRLLQQDTPMMPLFFERSSVLLTQGAVDAITPTATDPFYGLERWQVNWSDAAPIE